MRIAIKLGTSVVTKENGAPDLPNLQKIVKQVADVANLLEHEVILISSGAVGWGKKEMPELAKSNVDTSMLRISSGTLADEKNHLKNQILASIGQPKLISSYSKLFSDYGLNVSQILLTRHDIASKERYPGLRAVVLNLLREKIIPIINENDVISLRFPQNFRDNDELSVMASAAFQVDMLVMLTNVDGVFDGDPRDPNSKVVPRISSPDDIPGELHFSQNSMGRGGMSSKIQAATDLAGYATKVVIANGREENIILRIIRENEKIGTWFEPKGKRLNQKRSWLGLAAQSKGEIEVSVMVADDLRKGATPRNVMLLGVERVRGSFLTGEVVTLIDDSGKVLGRGQTKLSSSELTRLVEDFQSGDGSPSGTIAVIDTSYYVSAPGLRDLG